MLARTKTHQVGKSVFNIKSNYDNIVPVGKGSYGVVVSSINRNSSEKIAIKKIAKVNGDVQDAKLVLREVRLMRYLSAHRKIITIKDLSYDEEHDHLYIYMELLDSDLHRVIQSKQVLSDEHNRYFMYQILRALRYMHKQNIIHRDLKPGNILVNKDCDIRISDFGMARAKPSKLINTEIQVDQMAMTKHIVTRWYRPPELMMHPDGLYTSAVDMWSVGCIFAELIGRKPLFPGKNFVHQLTLILDVLGCPKDEEISHITSHQAIKFLDKISGKKKKPFSSLFPANETNNLMAIDLIEKLLVFDPLKRLSANAALNHPYFAPLQALDEAHPDPPPAMNMDFGFEQEDKNLESVAKMKKLKELINAEVEYFEDNRVADTFSNAYKNVKSDSNLVEMSPSNYYEDNTAHEAEKHQYSKFYVTTNTSSKYNDEAKRRETKQPEMDTSENKENIDPSRSISRSSESSHKKYQLFKKSSHVTNFYGSTVTSRIKEDIFGGPVKNRLASVTKVAQINEARKVTPDDKICSRKKRGRPRTIPKSPKFSLMSWQKKLIFD